MTAIALLHMGGLGDIVLAAPAFAAIRRAMPDAYITLYCRRPFLSVRELYPGVFDATVPIEFDPYAFIPTEASALEPMFPILEESGGSQPDLFISAELVQTWFTPVLAASMQPKRSLKLASPHPQNSAHDVILSRLDLQKVPFETYDVQPEASEQLRYRALIEHLGFEAVPSVLNIDERAEEFAAHFFEERELVSRSVLACFIGGNALVSLKRWPVERFCAVIEHAVTLHEVTPLLIGGSEEREELQRNAALLRERGIAAEYYMDEEASLPKTAAIIAKTRGFLGNDTGLAHLAAALGVPGLTVYGGGTLPSYAAWAPGTAGVVHPLPCFGCGWDCAFGHALCLESLEVRDVIAAFDDVLKKAPGPPYMHEVRHRTKAELAIIGDASRRFREAQADRALRFDTIVWLQHELEVECIDSERRLRDIESELQAFENQPL